MSEFEGVAVGSGSSAILPSQIDRPAPPTKEVMPAGLGWMPQFNYSLGRSIDDLTRSLSFKVYEAMLTDPAVASSYNSHKMAILKGGIRLVSPVKQAWAQKSAPGAEPEATPGEASEVGQTLTPHQKRALEILEFCERAFLRIRVSLPEALFELLDAMHQGHKLAEITYRVPEEGVDAGKLVFESIKVKPNWAWRFVVDNKMNVKGILTYFPYGGYVVYPPDKFIWLSWMPKDSDPRGTSLFRAPYNSWNLKIQAWPNFYNFVKRFGQPGLDFEMAEGDNADERDIDANGNSLPANPDGSFPMVSAHTYYAKLLSIYQGGGSFVHPAGSKLTLAEPESTGEALLNFVELQNREIMLGIEYQTRAALEAQHGSRADSQTAADRKSVATDFGSDWLAQGLFKAVRHLVELNFGAEDADLYSPWPTFGNTDAKDRPDLWVSAGTIGYHLSNSQLQDMDAELGLPIRSSNDTSIAGTPPTPPPTPGAPKPKKEAA